MLLFLRSADKNDKPPATALDGTAMMDDLCPEGVGGSARGTHVSGQRES